MKSTSHALTRMVLTVLLILNTAHAQNAGDRSAYTWYTFDWGGHVLDAVKAAEDAMRAAGLTVKHFPSGWETDGTSDHVTVVVSCVPLGKGSHIFVVATSSDQSTTQFFSNDIRRRIINTQPPIAID
jgi:hypothetical protein